MEQFPEQLGRIFQLSDDISDDTNFDRAVLKFGQKKVLQVLEECMPPADQACTVKNLYAFMIAASHKRSSLSAIYHVLRQMPSLVSVSIIAGTSNTTQSGKKRKQLNISKNTVMLMIYKPCLVCISFIILGICLTFQT